MAHLLLIDDDPALMPGQVRQSFPAPEHRVEVAATGAEGLDRVIAESPDVILLDLRLPDQSGLEVYRQIRRVDARIPVIFITIVKGADAAIEAMKEGAFDYLFKPFDPERLRQVIGEALEVSRRMRTPAVIAEADPDPDVDGTIVGTCPAMLEVYKAIGLVAAQNVAVLITGESGTGKELIVRALYQHSLRAKAPFLAINCAAIPENLLESEMFGHEKGAFTGADRRRIGKFEQCNGGTILLDEVGDMPLALQAKMLRILQEQSFERVGGNETIRTDVRLIAATHRDLKAWSDEGRFRQDLYYRLSVFTIHLPPLRERDDDLRLLVRYYCDASAANSVVKFMRSTPRRCDSCTATPGRGISGSCRACSSRRYSNPAVRRCSPAPCPPFWEPSPDRSRRHIRRRPIPASRRSSAGAWPPWKTISMPKRTARWTGSFWPAPWRGRTGTSSGPPDGWGSAGRPYAAGSAKWEST